jgi:CDP-glucose 4,6-dehydratase
VVVASSDKAYGEHEDLPYTEEAELKGSHPYDVSKTCADLIAQTYSESYGLPVCISRCGNLFGAGDLNFNRLIPGTIRSIHRGEPPLIRSDGGSTRDYVYVEDASDAYLVLAQAITEQPSIQGNAFNFSYERPMKTLEVVETILAQMERTDLQPKVLNEATNEIPHQFLEAGKARRMLGWEPRRNFEEGLQKTIPWYLDVLNERLSVD